MDWGVELMSVRRSFSRTALLFIALFTAALPFAAPEICAKAFKEGLTLCGGPLLLSLFPFLIVSSLLIQCGAEGLGFFLAPVARCIGLESPCAQGILLVGLLGGFAPAASAAAEGVCGGRISAREASALLPACICSAPAFVIVTVGGQMLGSTALGLRLFVAQVLAGWLTAALLNRLPRAKGEGSAPVPPPVPNAPPRLDAVISASAVTYLKLCGFVLYFRMLAAGAAALLPEKLAFLPAMLLEVSSGCDLASRTGLWASTLCCAALSLQGISVLLQVRTICPPEVSLKPLLVARIVHLPLSLALFYLSIPEKALETFNTMCERVVTLRRVPPDCALLAFFVCCMLSCELCRVFMEKQQKKC